MTMSLLQTFRSLKPHIHPPSPPPKHPSSPLKSTPSSSSPAAASQLKASPSPSSKKSSWSVYLILSTNAPIKTYVGVTTNFSRRLKQHNGELKGGAKASRSGRPWVCACIIRGFKDQSEACELESKWKNFSRKLPRKRKTDEMEKNADNGSILLLQHRQAALSKVKGVFSCNLSLDVTEDSNGKLIAAAFVECGLRRYILNDIYQPGEECYRCKDGNESVMYRGNVSLCQCRRWFSWC